MATQQIERLIAPEYSTELPERDLDALREMRDECVAIETTISYTRRLAQGRFEILSAERRRRAEGGSVSELVADLPRILGGERGRASAANARLAPAEQPIVDIDWGEKGRLIADESLANLDALSDVDLAQTVDALRDFERELSGYRHELHHVLDAIEHEIATRAADNVG